MFLDEKKVSGLTKMRGRGVRTWPDCVSGSTELLLLHQIRLVDYDEVGHGNLPARTLNVSLYFLHARVWLGLQGWQQATLAQMGAERCLAWRWKHKQRAGMQRVVQRLSFHRVCLPNSNKHTAAGGRKQRRPGRRTHRVAVAPSTATRPRGPRTLKHNHSLLLFPSRSLKNR